MIFEVVHQQIRRKKNCEIASQDHFLASMHRANKNSKDCQVVRSDNAISTRELGLQPPSPLRFHTLKCSPTTMLAAPVNNTATSSSYQTLACKASYVRMQRVRNEWGGIARQDFHLPSKKTRRICDLVERRTCKREAYPFLLSSICVQAGIGAPCTLERPSTIELTTNASLPFGKTFWPASPAIQKSGLSAR